MRSIHDPRYLEMVGLLRAAREGLDLTQSDLADRLGKSQSYVSKIETAERRADVIEVVDICKALGVPLQAVVPPHVRRTIK